MIPEFYIGQVIDNNDTDKKGKVQIFVPAIHNENQKSLCPWAEPWQAGFNADIPPKNTFVWVFFEKPDIHQQPYYMPPLRNDSDDVHALYSSIKSNIGASGASATYPDVKLFATASGNIVGISNDSSNSEIFLYQKKNNTQFYINNAGEIYIKAKKLTVVTTSSTDPAIKINDGTYEMACVNENMVTTILGLQPIQPTTSPTRLLTKPKV